MVLESIFSPKEAEKQPLDMFLLGFAAASVGIWLAYYIFPQGASSWFLFLTSLALVPLIYNIFFLEEEKDEHLTRDSFLHRHEEVILVFLFLFFGMVIAFSFWYTILPDAISSIMFADQINEVMRIQGLRAALVGALVAPAVGFGSGFAISKLSGAMASDSEVLKLIMLNNLRLLFLFIAFSFVFGAGAILLLTWNAAVVGVAIGNLVRETIVATAHIFSRSAIYFKALPFSFLAFFVHGIFEILGYFIGAIAGGIFSVAIVRKQYQSEHFSQVLKDVGLLVLLAVLLIVFGAFVEVYVTPVL